MSETYSLSEQVNSSVASCLREVHFQISGPVFSVGGSRIAVGHWLNLYNSVDLFNILRISKLVYITKMETIILQVFTFPFTLMTIVSVERHYF